jgi:hypothetical protein
MSIGRLISYIVVVALTACAHAPTARIDDRWIVERVVAGKFDELRAVKAESDQGSPVAMYWWGALLDGCVYERCDPDGARTLWLEAARASNSRAKLALMYRTRSLRDLDEVIQKTGAPVSAEERSHYATILWVLSALSSPSDRKAGEKAIAMAKELAESERRMDAMYSYYNRVGFMHFPDETRAMVEAGLTLASEDLRRMLVIKERAENRQLLARARAGDLLVGIALCETIALSEGREVLPPALLPICERALSLGYAGIAPVLLRHHRLSGNANAASFYAELCAATLATGCPSELADYHDARTGRSPEWQVWDAVAAIVKGTPSSEAGLPPDLMRRVFSIRVRIEDAERACLARRFDPSTKKFNDEPGCPPRRPVAIPRQFLSSSASR